MNNPWKHPQHGFQPIVPKVYTLFHKIHCNVAILTVDGKRHYRVPFFKSGSLFKKKRKDSLVERVSNSRANRYHLQRTFTLFTYISSSSVSRDISAIAYAFILFKLSAAKITYGSLCKKDKHCTLTPSREPIQFPLRS